MVAETLDGADDGRLELTAHDRALLVRVRGVLIGLL
jgi:hypothetical protein